MSNLYPLLDTIFQHKGVGMHQLLQEIYQDFPHTNSNLLADMLCWGFIVDKVLQETGARYVKVSSYEVAIKDDIAGNKFLTSDQDCPYNDHVKECVRLSDCLSQAWDDYMNVYGGGRWYEHPSQGITKPINTALFWVHKRHNMEGVEEVLQHYLLKKELDDTSFSNISVIRKM